MAMIELQWIYILWVFCAISWQAQASTTMQGTSPVTKVVQMLTDMLGNAKAQRQDEAVQYAKYEAFCGNTLQQKQDAINEGNDSIEQLHAAVEKAVSDVRVTVKRISSLDNDIAVWKNDMKVAMKKRKEESILFKQTHLEYQESLKAIERALDYLNKPGSDLALYVKNWVTDAVGSASFAQIDQRGMLGASLLQVSATTRIAAKHKLRFGQKQRMLLKTRAFTQDEAMEADSDREWQRLTAQEKEAADRAWDALDDDSSSDSAAPEAKAWKSSSGDVISLVEKLGAQFENEKMELEKREANQINAHQMMIADLTAQIRDAKKARAQKASEKQLLQGAKAEFKGQLSDIQASVTEDERFLNDLKVECQDKAWTFQQKQGVRKSEIEALVKAIELMKGVSQSGPELAQVSRRNALVQLRSKSESSKRGELIEFLRRRAGEMHSTLLMLIAQKASADPLAKVRKLVQEMIVKLMEAENESAEQKAFCDTELQTNQQTRESKTADIEGIKANIEGLVADISKLSDQIGALNNELKDIDAAVAKATLDRQNEQAKNKATIADATVAGQATAKALEVLKDFYNRAAQPVAQPAPQQGPIQYDSRSLAFLKTEIGGDAAGDSPVQQKKIGYSGQASSGVLGLLEVIQSDFTKLAAETEGGEQEAANEYGKFMADSEQSKAIKVQDLKHREREKTAKEVAYGELKKNHRILREELDAALKYYDRLKPDCETQGPSYEERVAERKKEIESLQEALQILSGNDIAVSLLDVFKSF
eukprot:gnl/MRDRNA2_/MRDRNA2_45383_c0_seq1.p1 gnl/MRDRNA2_/MRDRNA2_45383_c0~~gnl/MRDRNA2_/MRDRNA2_45383_c0_seq1.p1  ORF type:complete len:765 (+),score=212.63 gnl/MRDRNA2_/MRDRNA2_45383_c0_seq1:108-2402(+)